MKDILSEIVLYKQRLLKIQKQRIRPERLRTDVERALADGLYPQRSMRQSLAQSSSGIIAEFKRKSPSKGWIHADAKANEVPHSYYDNGAAAISILTDSWYFGGNPNFVRYAHRNGVQCPILRKDFIIDPFQVYQTRQMGADAILLIAACLQPDQCQELASLAHELQLETLLEIHSEDELCYVNPSIDMVGVNNRNLGTFHTDVQNSYRLAHQLPPDYLLVSESGISSPQTVRELRQQGFRGFLIGETFMRTSNPGEALRQFIQEVEK